MKIIATLISTNLITNLNLFYKPFCVFIKTKQESNFQQVGQEIVLLLVYSESRFKLNRLQLKVNRLS